MWFDYSGRRVALHTGGTAAVVYSSQYFTADPGASFEYAGDLSLALVPGTVVAVARAHSSVLPLVVEPAAAVAYGRVYGADCALGFGAGGVLSFIRAVVGAVPLSLVAGAGWSRGYVPQVGGELALVPGAAVQFVPAGDAGQSYEYSSDLELVVSPAANLSRAWVYGSGLSISLAASATVIPPGVVWVPACIVALIEPDIAAYVELDLHADIEPPLVAYIEDCYE